MLLDTKRPAAAVAAVHHEGNAAGACAHAIWGTAGCVTGTTGHGATAPAPAAEVPAAEGSDTVYTCDCEAHSDEVEDESGSNGSPTSRARLTSAAAGTSGYEGPAKRCRTGIQQDRKASPPPGGAAAASSPPLLPTRHEHASHTARDTDALPRRRGGGNAAEGAHAASAGLVLRLTDVAPGLVPAVARVVRLAGALSGHVPLVLVQHRTEGDRVGNGALLPPPPPPGTVRTLYQMPDGRLLPGKELRSTPAGGGRDGGRYAAATAARLARYSAGGISSGRGEGDCVAAAAPEPIGPGDDSDGSGSAGSGRGGGQSQLQQATGLRWPAAAASGVSVTPPRPPAANGVRRGAGLPDSNDSAAAASRFSATVHVGCVGAAHVGTPPAGAPPSPWLPQPLWLDGVPRAAHARSARGGGGGVSGAGEPAGGHLQHAGALEAAPRQQPQPHMAAAASRGGPAAADAAIEAYAFAAVTNIQRSEPHRAGHGAPQPPPFQLVCDCGGGEHDGVGRAGGARTRVPDPDPAPRVDFAPRVDPPGLALRELMPAYDRDLGAALSAAAACALGWQPLSTLGQPSGQ